MNEVKLSVVTTLYRSAEHLLAFHERMSASAGKITPDFEMILVDDGSPDDSLELALRLHAGDGRVRVIELSRNFGHHNALLAGMAQARGELVFIIDSDLEEDPELINLFHDRMMQTGSDVVFGVQDRRKGSPFERISGHLFYRTLALLTNEPVQTGALTARLMTRAYVDGLLAYGEREIYIDGLFTLAGFRQTPLKVRKHSRSGSSYSLRKKIGLGINAITSFSNRPLILISCVGAVISLMAGLSACWLVLSKLFLNPDLDVGWPSIVVSIWFLGGVTIFCLGVIGIYVAKVFNETKKRPRAIIRRIHGAAGRTPSPPAAEEDA